MQALRLDHLVLTVSDIDATERWYAEAPGLEGFGLGHGRRGLRVGEQKINLHPLETDISPRAAPPTPGSADLCLVTETDLEAVCARLRRAGVAIEAGPVQRSGARAVPRSIYVRDPDRNLIEIANEVTA